MMELVHEIFGTDYSSALLVVFNLFLIESLLSIDNAAVLATMVLDLPLDQRKKALRYGIIGAYVFRGLCLLFASMLVKVIWLKGIGGVYLLWLTFDYFRTKATPEESDDLLNKKQSSVYSFMLRTLGTFWSTVAMVEIMDLAFSIDNVFAAVAFTQNIYLICMGVFIGILAMRFVAESFVKLIEAFPFLEAVAFIVIGVLGFKLTIACICDYFAGPELKEFVNGHGFDLAISLLTVLFFTVPIMTSIIFNYPKRKVAEGEEEEAVNMVTANK